MGSGEGFTMREFVVLYHSPNIVRVIKYRTFRWADHISRIEEDRNIFKVLTAKPTGKRFLETFRR